MNLHATQPHESKPEETPAAAGSPVAAGGRFAYASGSRPLPGYTIKRGIGHGGFGEVYYATSDAGKEVALKLIRRNWDIELRGVTQCLNLKHPNLLSLYDVKQDEHGDNWVVMELMSGESLEEVVGRNPNGLPPAEALAWIHGIAAGVAYLHDHGIVHRDLKPGNIFVDEGIVKIGDYGLSKFMSCSRRSGQTGSVGTVHYMAPEIANGRYGKEIDIYALGIILYEMLTGHVPFEGESVGEILMKHLTAEPDLSQLVEPYKTIVSRSLAKDPQTRFNSANELIDMLPPVPTGAALTAAARFAGPTMVVGGAPAGAAAAAVAGRSGYSLAPEVAAANQSATAQYTPAGAGAGTGQGAAGGDAPQDHRANEEPVARWIRETTTDFRAWWDKKNFKPWQKLLILLVGLLVVFNVLTSSGAPFDAQNVSWRKFIEFLLLAWVIYWVVRKKQTKNGPRSGWGPYGRPIGRNAPQAASAEAVFNQPQAVAAAAPVAGTATPAAAPRDVMREPFDKLDAMHESPTRTRWKRTANLPLYQPGTPRERFTQLLGSMLFSTLACLVVSLVVMILRGDAPDPGQYAWLASSAVLGSWAVLIPSKFWEGTRGDPVLRRFIMLVVGLAYAVVSFGITTWLVVPVNNEIRWGDLPGSGLEGNFYDSLGAPKSIAFLAYFGFLFFLVRWWRLADPLRSTRLSIWYTAVTVFCSMVVGAFWPFPQPWGWMLTATVAIAVQLASPWLSPAERAQLPLRSATGG